MKLATPLLSDDLRDTLRILDGYRRRYLLGCLCMTGTDVGQLAIPWLIGRLVDGLAAHRLAAADVTRYTLAIVASSLFISLARYGWRSYLFGTARLVDRDLRQRLYDHLQSLSLDFHLRHKVGDLMAYATNDITAVRTVAGEGVMSGWDAVSMFIGTVAMVVGTVDWRLGLAAFLPMAMIVPTTYLIGRKLHRSYEEVQGAFAHVSDRAQEGFTGVRVVKGFAREAYQHAQFAKANQHYRGAYARMSGYDMAFDPSVAALAGLAAAVGLLYGGYLVLAGELSVGQFVAFNSFLGMLTWPMLALGWTVNLLQRASASVGRLQRIFAETPSVMDRAAAIANPAPKGHLRLDHLTFAYAPELPPALVDVSLDAPPGSTIGLMGPTGAGKSTLANLLVRLFNPPAGQVLVDGLDVNDWKLADLRAAIAYAPQDGFLFSRSIAANIAFDPHPHSDEAVREAASRAQLDADVLGFAHGYDTMLGERGVTLSGGQRQRVGIARALLVSAPVLVLDDCLSAVDADTEARLVAQLQAAPGRRTTLVISHRTSALAHCDEILVLEAGRVIERGRHAELLRLGGAYARTHQLQQLEAAVERG